MPPAAPSSDPLGLSANDAAFLDDAQSNWQSRSQPFSQWSGPAYDPYYPEQQAQYPQQIQPQHQYQYQPVVLDVYGQYCECQPYVTHGINPQLLYQANCAGGMYPNQAGLSYFGNWQGNGTYPIPFSAIETSPQPQTDWVAAAGLKSLETGMPFAMPGGNENSCSSWSGGVVDSSGSEYSTVVVVVPESTSTETTEEDETSSPATDDDVLFPSRRRADPHGRNHPRRRLQPHDHSQPLGRPQGHSSDAASESPTSNEKIWEERKHMSDLLSNLDAIRGSLSASLTQCEQSRARLRTQLARMD